MVAESVTSRKNELRSLSAVDIQGHQRGGFCIVPIDSVCIANLLTDPIVSCSSCTSDLTSLKREEIRLLTITPGF